LTTRQRIFITGRVQGVGFRPAVYRMAQALGLTGFVYNDTKGVTIELQGNSEKISEFLKHLKSSDKPPLAEIKSCKAVDIASIEDENEFIIKISDTQGTALSQVTADIATCRDCLAEMADKNDFRYRYPFINCTNCGPRYSIVKTIPYDRPNTTMSVFEMCDKCAAQYNKKRDHKPFAMMAVSIEKIKEYAVVSKPAEKALKSPQSPIVLLPKKKNSAIATSVAEGVDSFGFMLCYTPLHYLLFAEGIEVLVMTSGNISDEPLICKNQTALEKLGSVADAFLMHDRDIYRQVDDSVIHFIDGQPVPLRRARGYVPTPIFMEKGCQQDIFAAGSDLKNTFCFVKQNQLICSEHIGDLADAEVYHHYIDSIEHLRQLFEVEPKTVACDLHPGYFSTQYALSITDVHPV